MFQQVSKRVSIVWHLPKMLSQLPVFSSESSSVRGGDDGLDSPQRASFAPSLSERPGTGSLQQQQVLRVSCVGTCKRRCHLLLADSWLRSEYPGSPDVPSLCASVSLPGAAGTVLQKHGNFVGKWCVMGLNACLKLYVKRVGTSICSSFFLDSGTKCKTHKTL